MADRYIDTISLGWSEGMINRYSPKESCKMSSTITEVKENKSSFESDEDRFVHAASKGDLKNLLEYTSTMVINTKNSKDETPLIAASIGGHQNAVFFLLSKGADVSIMDLTGNTALHHAAFLEHVGIIDKLVLKCDINMINKRGQTVLHVAVENNNQKVFEHIIKMPNINMNAQDSNGNTAVHIAIKAGNLKIICKILSTPIDLSLYNNDGMNPFNLAVKKDGIEILKLLVQTKHGMDILPCRTTYGESNLEIAIRERNSEILSYLLTPSFHPELMINSEIDRKYGATALHWAVFILDIDLVERIIQMNSELLNVKDKFGKTPLDHLCCMHEFEDKTKDKLVNVAIKLISEGTDMNLIENKSGLFKLIKDIFQFRFAF